MVLMLCSESPAVMSPPFSFTRARNATSNASALDPGVPYLVAVHPKVAGQCGRFSLTASADAPLTLALIPPTRHAVLAGAFRGVGAAGCHLAYPGTGENPSWTDNPQYELRVAAACSLTLSLRRPARHWDRHNKRLSAHTRTSSREMEAMISFYVIEGTAGGGARLHAPSRRKVSVRHMAPFVPLHENSVTLKLSPLPNDAPYIIMPCTFGAGQRGPFSLGATADGDFELLPLPDVVPPNT